MFSVFQLIAALLAITALFAWLNSRFVRLPQNIGLLVMGLAASGCLLLVEMAFPSVLLHQGLVDALEQIDFYDTLMNGALAFLLFAGALHVDIGLLRERAWGIAAMATLGVGVTSLIVGYGIWLVSGWLGLQVSFLWACVFGALIAPTDPVAVLSTLKATQVPETLEADMAGESLFNDGIGVVLFTLLLAAASSASAHHEGEFSVWHGAQLLVVEAGGGVALGVATGYLAFLAMRSIDDYDVEILITLGLVSATYALASALHLSGPIAVVAAGLLIGNRGAARGMSEQTRRYLFGFWEIIDEILNAVLFLLIGLEVLVLSFKADYVQLALAAIPLVLFARFVSVGGSVLALRPVQRFVPGTIPVLTWGGVRGGISIALALSLPMGPERGYLLSATYGVVLFTILVQGMTLSKVVRRTVRRDPAEPAVVQKKF